MFTCRVGAALSAALLLSAWSGDASAQEPETWLMRAGVFRDIETENIFGFTEGASISPEGEKELSLTNEARMGKGEGRYFGSESKLGFEFTPNQYIQLEFGPFFSAHSISNVPDLDDRRQFGFGGFFGEIKTILLERNSNSPLALSFSAEPNWRRLDETSGERVNNVELELKLQGDVELVAKRLYLGFNLLYEPEATHDPDRVGAGWEQESKAGISGSLAYRLLPQMTIGAEVWYLRHYEGTWLNSFTGDAVYIGPTLSVQVARKVHLSAAWNTQVTGRDADNPDAKFNFSEFSRHRAKLKLAVEF
jgi:hypothetical protein